jgi:four helix bundle protein
MSYKKLEIWQLAKELVIDIHRMTLELLPKFEMFEEGGQIRRSIKSVKSTIVEGYGRREYKQEFLRFLSYAIASNDETLDHLETLFETGSLTSKDLYSNLSERLNTLGKKLYNFRKPVEESHQSKK